MPGLRDADFTQRPRAAGDVLVRALSEEVSSLLLRLSHRLREPIVARGLRALVLLSRAAVVSGWAGGAAGFGLGLGFHGEGDAVSREIKGMVAPSACSLAVAATEAGFILKSAVQTKIFTAKAQRSQRER